MGLRNTKSHHSSLKYIVLYFYDKMVKKYLKLYLIFIFVYYHDLGLATFVLNLLKRHSSALISVNITKR